MLLIYRPNWASFILIITIFSFLISAIFLAISINKRYSLSINLFVIFLILQIISNFTGNFYSQLPMFILNPSLAPLIIFGAYILSFPSLLIFSLIFGWPIYILIILVYLIRKDLTKKYTPQIKLDKKKVSIFLATLIIISILFVSFLSLPKPCIIQNNNPLLNYWTASPPPNLKFNCDGSGIIYDAGPLVLGKFNYSIDENKIKISNIWPEQYTKNSTLMNLTEYKEYKIDGNFLYLDNKLYTSDLERDPYQTIKSRQYKDNLKTCSNEDFYLLEKSFNDTQGFIISDTHDNIQKQLENDPEEFFIKLSQLDCVNIIVLLNDSYPEITNLDYFKNMSELKVLILNGFRIENISGISGITTLEEINLFPLNEELCTELKKNHPNAKVTC